MPSNTYNSYSIGSKKITAMYHSDSAGQIFEMHSHDYIELELILSGRGEHIYNSDIYEVSCGHAYIVTHHDLHTIRLIEDTTVINICFDIDMLSKNTAEELLADANRSLCCRFEGKEFDDLCDDFNAIVRETENPGFLSDELCRVLTEKCVIKILRRSDSISKHSPTLSQLATEYIHRNFKKELSLGILAEVLSVTPNYLGRIFLRDTGASFNKYLNRIRLRCACNLLLFSSVPINKVASMSGYSSLEYFFSVFKKEFGIPPGSYRQTYGKRLSVQNVSASSVII